MAKYMIDDSVNIVLSHPMLKGELEAASDLAESLNRVGELTGRAMQFKDAESVSSVMDSLIWFIKHPETVDAGKLIIVGAIGASIERWFGAGSRRSLRIEYGKDYKVVVNNIKELERAIALLPPPVEKAILEDGDMIENGRISKSSEVEVSTIKKP